MTSRWQVALPEAWRIQLMRDPARSARWRSLSFERVRSLSLLDWEDSLGPGLIVAALDLSTAELIVKLRPDVRVIGIEHCLDVATFAQTSTKRLLDRARASVGIWVEPTHRPSSLPPDPLTYLEPALRRAAELS